MKHLFFLLLIFLCSHVIAQINYPTSGLSTTACNVFTANPVVNAYTHYATFGGVSFDGTSLYLPFQATSTYQAYGVAYSINYPLQVGKAYTIVINAATPAGAPSAPSIRFSASTSLPGSSTVCTLQDLYTITSNIFKSSDVIKSTTNITTSSFSNYTVVSNFYPMPGYNYLNIASAPFGVGTNYTSQIKIKSITISGVSPATAPKINNATDIYFSATKTSGAGYITGTPGATVTVSVGSGGPPPGSYIVSMSITGASFTDGSTSISTTNTSAVKQFILPASGSVSWNGTFSEPNSSGSGSIGVK